MEEAFTSEHWLVRIYRVKKDKNVKSTKFGDKCGHFVLKQKFYSSVNILGTNFLGTNGIFEKSLL